MKALCKFVGFKDYLFMYIVRIRLRFFFRKKWLKFIKVEIYKEASYEIYKCFVSLLNFFFEKKVDLLRNIDVVAIPEV